MNVREEDVVWRTYPDYPFVEVNQFGEVRTRDRAVKGKDGKEYHIKGCVLKQCLLPHGYMQVRFHANGKYVHLYVHRMVATCFIPNPNGYPEVNHIDNDPTNNSVSNLEWCTREYNIAYKEKYGKSAAEVSGRPVSAVDLETGKVIRFESQHEAARQLGVSQGEINSVIKGKLYQAMGCWFTEDEGEITEEKIREIKSNMRSTPMIAVNIETSEVFWFESQREAERQLGVDHSSISKVAKGKQNKAGGFWFCNADENSVEKVRAKFGDEIAEKVERLMNKNDNHLNKL